jgi:hypothetical protein
MDIELLRQPTKTTCGETCVAMLTGVSVQEVRDITKSKRGTQARDLVGAISTIGGFTVEPEVKKAGQDLPMTAICRVYWHRRSKKSPTGFGAGLSRNWHWVLYHNGTFYDPTFGIVEGWGGRGKLTHFMAVKKA